MTSNFEPPSVYRNSDERVWIVLSHLSVLLGAGILLPLIIYLIKKSDSADVAYHSREALNFHLSLLVYGVICGILTFFIIGIPLLFLLGVATVFLSILAAVRASDGVEYRYPCCIRFI